MPLYATGGIGQPSAHSDILTVDNPTTQASRASLIDEIKRRGRACVISKNYHDADALYGKGIEILSLVIDGHDGGGEDDVTTTTMECKKDIAIFYSNRSLVRLSMNKVTEAMEDANLAISNDGTYVKAHWRRGQACNAAGSTNEALTSFEKALELDPTNKALLKEVQIAKEKLKVEQELLLSANNIDAHGDPVGIMESSESKEDFIKRMESSSKKAVAATSSSTPQSATTNTTTNTKSKSTTVNEEHDSTSLFTKSDHVRGYKIRSDGKKTSYFDREIDDEAKKLLGDIAPKKLSSSNNNTENVGNNGGGGGGGTSVWNKAGE